jgi:uncharacterized membrane protein
LLIAGFATDVLYWRTLLFQWNNFSVWLTTAGLLIAALATLALALDATRGRMRASLGGASPDRPRPPCSRY